jgi:alkylation response protein AidB-like acyl-CoA dehydrogenase
MTDLFTNAVREYPVDAPYRDLMERSREVADRVLAPRANQSDQAALLPAENIRRLAEAGLLGLTAPVAYGGVAAPAGVVRDFLETLAGACGVTAFVVFQHIVACRHIAGGENEALKGERLPALATGDRFCTVAFSHLRRPGPPTLRVELDGAGYVFNGTAPWATGWGLAHDVLLAGTLPDGNSLWVVAPLVERESFRISPPMRLCGMNASATVALTCRDLRFGPESCVKRMTAEQLAADTTYAILFFSVLSLGAASAAVRLMRTLAQARGSTELSGAAEALAQEVTAARHAVNAAAEEISAPGARELRPAGGREANAKAARVRAWCIDLGVRAAHAAVAASGGGANSLDHAAQRLFREAMVYTLTAQTRDLQTATVARLLDRSAGQDQTQTSSSS